MGKQKDQYSIIVMGQSCHGAFTILFVVNYVKIENHEDLLKISFVLVVEISYENFVCAILFNLHKVQFSKIFDRRTTL